MCCVKVANELDWSTCEREIEIERERGEGERGRKREIEREIDRDREKYIYVMRERERYVMREREHGLANLCVCGYRFVIQNSMQVYSPHVHMQYKCSK
jgi:hypothetical protein